MTVDNNDIVDSDDDYLQDSEDDVEMEEYKIYIKLQPVPPSMSSESLSVRLSGINSASNDIDGGTSCNFIIYFFQIKLNYIDQSVVCVAYLFI